MAGFVTAVHTGSAAMGVAGGGAGRGGLLTRSSRGSSIDRRANQLATGLALMFAGVGLSALLGAPYVGGRSPASPSSGARARQPAVLGPALFAHDALVYAAVPIALAGAVGALLDALGARVARGGREPDRRPSRPAENPRALQYQALLLAGALGWHRRRRTCRSAWPGRGQSG